MQQPEVLTAPEPRTSDQALDKDLAMQGEVRNAAKTLLDAVLSHRDKAQIPGSELHPPRQK